MLKQFKSFLPLLSIFVILVGFLCSCEKETSSFKKLSRLHAEEMKIVDENGEEVQLRGVNLGAWLFHETWISAVDYPLYGRAHILAWEMGIGEDVDAVIKEIGPGDDEEWLEKLRKKLELKIGKNKTDEFIAIVSQYPSIWDDADLPLRLLLEERFGIGARDELLDVFQEAWIREKDIKWLSLQGFNLVRIPIGYRTLIINSDKEPLTELMWNERAFHRLDNLINWCEKYSLYAVIDIQEAPGGQNDYSGPPKLYEDENMQLLTIEMWKELSRRYSEVDVVAGYSLLAEPFGAPSTVARDAMYDRLIKAIRDQGDDHLLIIHDGFFGLWTLPKPESFDWENVVYSTHLFEWNCKSLQDYQRVLNAYDILFKQAQQRQNVPYYIGSFSTMIDEDWAYEALGLMVNLFNKNGWSWSVWTFKKIDDPIDFELWGKTTAWGLLGRLGSDFSRPDIYRDDLETLKQKFSSYSEIILHPNEKMLEKLKSY